jgi:hypothetical protein
MRRASRTLGTVLASWAAAMLLTGCLKLELDLEVSSNDSVSGAAVLAIDKELLALSGQSVDQVFQDDDLIPGDAEGVSVADYDDGAFVGKQITFDGVPLDEFNQGDGSDRLTISREGDRFVVDGVLDLGFGNTIVTPQAQQLAQQAKVSAEIRISLSFPGPVTSANGTIDGNSVTWTPVFGERTTLEASAGATGSSSVLGLILGFVALAVFVGLVALFLAGSRNDAGASVTPVPPGARAEQRTDDTARAIPPGEPSQVPAPPPPVGTVDDGIVGGGGSTAEPEPE